MFKKLKDKIEEEFKQAPLKFPVSVQQLAQVISPSPSVNSLSDNNASSSFAYPTDLPNVSTDLFSIGGDDDSQDGVAKMQLTLQNVELTATSPSNMTHNMSRSRRSSLSSVTSEPSLFPIYESGLNQNFFQSDMESEFEDGMSGQIERISKEQLYQSFKKILNRYNKYKGRYTELLKHYKELQHDNFKTKNVLQESQDKALRRIAELREQCQLEQKAKAHLEESLRNDVEERDHIIDTLKTKISLLSNEENSHLIDLQNDQEKNSGADISSAELVHLKSQNEDLQKEVEKLKKIKETACHLVHRCDTTINEATEDVKSDKLKQKMSELKLEIQKMKSENESLSHLLSRNIITEEDKKLQSPGDSNLSTDLTNFESSQDDTKLDDKDKKIEKLNNLLLKCKEKINGLNSEIKAKNIIIENNNKIIKELKEEVQVIKVREEENAFSVAENKKAIHKELDAKEEQIKALTKELKTKENEFIKEKEETVKKYEEKIQNIIKDFSIQMDSKIKENEKLIKDAEAREKQNETLEKFKNIEEGFFDLLQLLKTKSFEFEALAKSNIEKIESAQNKLEAKMCTVKKNLTDLTESHQLAEKRNSKIFESPSAFKSSSIENVENFHVIEKLKSDVINLTKKIEILEAELKEAKTQSKANEEEACKWKERCENVDKEIETLKNEFQKKLLENTELGKALTNRNAEIKKFENEKEILQNASKEKIETESKLKEYVDKYNKLDVENRTLQNELMEKCGKLLKDLNESKEKVKNLEEEGKVKMREMESLRKRHLSEEKRMSKEIHELKKEWQNLKDDTNSNQQKFLEDLEKLKLESEKLRLVAAESVNLKSELLEKEEEMKILKTNLEAQKLKSNNNEELEIMKKEKIQDKEVNERLKNELEALRGNLKGELKEKEEKCILVDKLTQECNLLLAEIENLKKTHSNVEKKLENELQAFKLEATENKTAFEKLEANLAGSQKAIEIKEKEIEELNNKFRVLAQENEDIKQKLHNDEPLKHESTSDFEKMRTELFKSEEARQDLNEKIFKLTNEMNEAFGEIQMKENEMETLKSRLKSLTEELAAKDKSFEEEKLRLISENENKLNILKNEIKFINTKHEEDIGNYEENLNTEMKEANEKMEIAEKTSAELLEKLEKITCERDELKLREEEKNLKVAELESCMMALKTELDDKYNEEEKTKEAVSLKHNEEIKNIVMQYDKEIEERDMEIEVLKRQLEGFEDTEVMQSKHSNEVKKIIMQYDREIAERDEEIETLKAKILDNETNFEQLHSVANELKEVKEELAEKKILINQLETNKSGSKGSESKNKENFNFEEMSVEIVQGPIGKEERNKRIEKDMRILIEMLRNEKDLTTVSSGLKKNKITEINAGKKNECKTDVIVDGVLEEVELESAVKSPSGPLEEHSSGVNSASIEILQKQLIQQATEMMELKKQYKKEIFELRKLAAKKKSRKNSADNQDWYYTSGGLENDTEYEYLRNILYEYMMGKEQLVLAKVLSAIVKFNEEQTHNVLEKEQQRQTLFGQLGLL